MNAIARMRPRALTEVGATRRPAIPWVERHTDTYASSIENLLSDRITSATPPPSSPLAIPQSQERTSRRRPLAHPALLSGVADAFRQQISLNPHTKDGLTYPASFTGREAVDLIAFIIKTSDRNLALLLGRALGAQMFIYDATHKHRLRDSIFDIYQLCGPRPAPTSETKGERAKKFTPAQVAVPPPMGVFTLLTGCYSPTCNKREACYCSICPRRVDEAIRRQPQQLVVTNPSPPELVPSQITVASDNPTNVTEEILEGNLGEASSVDKKPREPGQLWIQSVSKKLADSVSSQERKRQEAINEMIYTECNFVRDLEYLRDRWVEPLQNRDIIPTDRRDAFVREVFWNVEEILDVNTRLRDLLAKRQNAHPIVETIGDIFLEIVPQLHPIVQYGKHQLYGKCELEKEKLANPELRSFVGTVERLPESRRLELNVYLTRPITHLVRYPLMLEGVLKHTPEDHVDRVAIPKAMKTIREFLAKMDEDRGKTENRLKLLQLEKMLVFRPGEEMTGQDLRLKDEQRQLIHQDSLEYRGGIANANVNLHVFLLDHVLLMARSKMVKKREQLEIFKRPIPLELLVISSVDEDVGQGPKSRTWFSRRSQDNRIHNGPSPPTSPTSPTPPTSPTSPVLPPSPTFNLRKKGCQIKACCLGRNGYTLTLWAQTAVVREKWMAKIAAQQEEIREQTRIFNMCILNEGHSLEGSKVNCVVPYDPGQRMACGMDDGVYFQHPHNDQIGMPEKRLNLTDVKQIDVLEEYQLLIVLSADVSSITLNYPGRDVFMSPLALIGLGDLPEPMTQVASHTSFFNIGHCLGRALLCTVTINPSGSTIKALEPTEQAIRGKSETSPKRESQGINDMLKVFKEFCVPYEVHSVGFLKTKICVARSTAFEVVDLESLDTQALLNPADISLDFMQVIGDLRPLNMYQVGTELLLCYNKFAFYVNKGGWWSRKNVIMRWEGNPTAFALHYPYILAFDPTFIEIRHLGNGALVQIILGNNLRLLFADTQLLSSNLASRAPPYTDAREEIILASDNKVMRVRLTPSLSPTSDESVSSRG